MGRALFVACALLTLGSIITMMVALPEGTTVSADADASTVSNWAIIAPSLAGIALTLALPWRGEPVPVVAVKRRRLLLTTAVLSALLAVFVLATMLLPLQGEDYILLKFVLLILLPAVLLLVVRGSVRIEARRGAWRWWAPLLVLAVWFCLSELAPWNPPYDPGDIDTGFLIVAATATAITASIGEELFSVGGCKRAWRRSWVAGRGSVSRRCCSAQCTSAAMARGSCGWTSLA